MGSNRLTLDVEGLLPLVGYGDLAIAASERIKQDVLVHRFGIPKTCWYKRRRIIAQPPVVGATEAIAVELERDLAGLSIVVAARGEAHELAPHPLLLGLMAEVIESKAEESDHDPDMRAD